MVPTARVEDSPVAPAEQRVVSEHSTALCEPKSDSAPPIVPTWIVLERLKTERNALVGSGAVAVGMGGLWGMLVLDTLRGLPFPVDGLVFEGSILTALSCGLFLGIGVGLLGMAAFTQRRINQYRAITSGGDLEGPSDDQS